MFVECGKFTVRMPLCFPRSSSFVSPSVLAVMEGSLQIFDSGVSVILVKPLTSLSFTLLSKMEIVGFNSTV